MANKTAVRTILFFKIMMLSLLLSSCASKYRNLEPTTLKFDQLPDTLKTGNVAFSWKYDVLGSARNRKYARKERWHNVRLLAVRVVNLSADTLFLPENLVVFSEKDTLRMLSADDAYAELRQNIADEPLASGGSVGDWLIEIIIDWRNQRVQKKANGRFSDELDQFYLTPSFVAPGKTTVGLLALPMKKKKPLRFDLRE